MTNDFLAARPQTDPRIAYFDHLAPAWDRTGPDPAVTLRRLNELQGRFGLVAGQHLLEIGCGTGQITGWLADRVKPGKVVAVDFSPAMLAQARARGTDAEFVLMDICREGTAPWRFDVALCFHSFPHFRDPQAALRHIAGFLKPGGQLLVAHLAGSAQLNARHHQIGGAVGHDHLPPAAAWPALLRPAGLSLVEAADREDLFWVRAAKSHDPAMAAPSLDDRGWKRGGREETTRGSNPLR